MRKEKIENEKRRNKSKYHNRLRQNKGSDERKLRTVADQAATMSDKTRCTESDARDTINRINKRRRTEMCCLARVYIFNEGKRKKEKTPLLWMLSGSLHGAASLYVAITYELNGKAHVHIATSSAYPAKKM